MQKEVNKIDARNLWTSTGDEEQRRKRQEEKKKK